MTRQEALHELYTIFGYGFYNERVDEALNMAIEALEQEETSQNLTKPNKSDLISRHEALKGYQSVCEGIACHECRAKDADGTCRLESFINNLPTAQPFTAEQIQTMQELESAQVEKAYELGKADRPTGHWIENAQEYYEMINEKGGGVDENTPYFTDDIACSECLAKFSVIDNETERFDFCPNCGSYNGGGEE